jgi:hypothetical protein
MLEVFTFDYWFRRACHWPIVGAFCRRTSALVEGVGAYRSDQTSTENPYEWGTPEAIAWRQGWNGAREHALKKHF